MRDADSPIVWPDLDAIALRLALGPFARNMPDVSGRGRGWCVALAVPDLRERNADEDAIRITEWWDTSQRATLEALFYAMARSIKRTNKRIKGTPGLLIVPELGRKCPKCGAARVVRICFGSIGLGYKCRLCPWERPIAE